ncbi:MAG TPA: fumarate reductase/succinate dehydrogenase flavoprotein subunit, partial [bacterium]|nr:fumarate reductase/succinate dehydrogenase flavoprotein subunit [bacterium]
LGANRLGGNSLSDLLVFGKRAGEHAAAYVRGVGTAPRVDDRQADEERRLLQRPFDGGGRENPFAMHEELQEVMGTYAGIARTGAQLEEGLQKVRDLQTRAAHLGAAGSRLFNPGWLTCRDVQFMLTVCEAIFRSAIERKESRGAHWRLDFPDQDPAWGAQNIIVSKGDGGMQVRTRPVPQMPAELARLVRPGG